MKRRRKGSSRDTSHKKDKSSAPPSLQLIYYIDLLRLRQTRQWRKLAN